MSYFLTVISGPDEGKTCLIGQGEVLIGRSPGSQLQLKDESISWEHAVVRNTEGRIGVRNLSALGTRVRGKRVTGEVRLSGNDELELSPVCKVLLVQQEGEPTEASSTRLAIMAVVALVVLLGIGTAVFFFTRPKARPITTTHWRTAYGKLSERVAAWQANRWVGTQIGDLFRDGWRFEQVENIKLANQRWERLNSLLLTLRNSEVTNDDLTFAQSASPTPKAMNVLMGWDQSVRSTDFEWTSHDAYADAMVWFVRKRADTTRKLLEELEAKAKGKKKGKAK